MTQREANHQNNALVATGTYMRPTERHGMRVRIKVARFEYSEVVPFTPEDENSLDVIYRWAFDHGYTITSHGIITPVGGCAVYAFVLRTNTITRPGQDPNAFKHPND